MVGILTMAHGLPVTGCSQGADTLTHAQGFSEFHKQHFFAHIVAGFIQMSRQQRFLSDRRSNFFGDIYWQVHARCEYRGGD